LPVWDFKRLNWDEKLFFFFCLERSKIFDI